MEKEVEMLLTAGGASEAGLAEKEMEELKSKVAFFFFKFYPFFSRTHSEVHPTLLPSSVHQRCFYVLLNVSLADSK